MPIPLDNFSISPHIPGGLITPDELHNIAAVAKKYGGTLKIAGGTITIMGLSLVNSEKAIAELGVIPESFIVKSVRSVAICPGKPSCPRAQQDSTTLGLSLDAAFFGQAVPRKVRIGVSGCPNCCAEVFVKDIGLYATALGYTLVVGGNAGLQAQIAKQVAKNIPSHEVAPIVRSVLTFFRQYGQTTERLGQTIDRLGWDTFIARSIPNIYRI